VPRGALAAPAGGADNRLVDEPACSPQPEAAMSRTPLALLLCLALPLCARPAEAEPEAPEGFTALFNGKDLTGWKVHGGKKESWAAEKGVLFVKGGRGGWLMTEKEYGDFELRLEFKVPKGGNSGVALRSPLKGDPAYSGMEVQILDDPAYKGLQKWQATGSIYGVVPASKVTTKKVGEWNSYKITCKGRKVTVELNGTKVVDTDLDDHKEKHGKTHPGILRDKGHIGLQEHGGRVEFRRISIKELK
jgi:3-keto-disaccharide hydrolase